MPVVHIPAPLRSLTGGESTVAVSGITLRELARSLDALHPGLAARLVDGNRIRSGMAVFVNSAQVSSDLATKVPEDADIYFAPAISGGRG